MTAFSGLSGVIQARFTPLSPLNAHNVGMSSLRWSWWNLLLGVPLLMLVTPVYDRVEPRVWGFPFFYWYQFLWVPVGVICTAVVYLMTRGDQR
ncbi:MAG: DUF3311 domain-containing protein [Pseudonocardiaceae bacterium]